MTPKEWLLLLIPTAISLASFYIALITFQKDKPKLKISATYSVGLREMPTISVTVNNVGKRPTTIIEAGFRPDNIVSGEVFNEKGASKAPLRGVSDIKLLPTPLLIDSGAAKQFTLELNQWPSPFVHADTHLLAYAKDVSGNYYYGKDVLSIPILRHILNSNGRVPTVPQHLNDPQKYKHNPLTPKDLYPNQRLIRIKIIMKQFLKAQL